MTGYVHPDYARALEEFGTPRALPLCGGWILERIIPGVPDRDGMGSYPVFACRDWSRLHLDLENLRQELVCVSLVSDPFGRYDPQELRECFPDVCYPFKRHFEVDLSVPRERFVHVHHRRKALKALDKISVEYSQEPVLLLKDWCRLYETLIRRHGIRGIAAFSEGSFARQLQVPGIVVFSGKYEGAIVGMTLWYIQGPVAYYHLGASDDCGYSLNVSFALFWSAIEYFAARGLTYLSLGAGAGLRDTPSDGLNRFKRGWSTGTKTAYLCGRILDPQRYAELSQSRQTGAATYFPAYRVGEYGD